MTCRTHIKYQSLNQKGLDNRIQWHIYIIRKTQTIFKKKNNDFYGGQLKLLTSRLLGLMSGLNLAPQTQPIRDKRKTNWVFLISIFPRLAWIYSSLWLAANTVCVVCCDWLADLTSILHAQKAFLEKLRRTEKEQTQFRKPRLTISTRVVTFLLFSAGRD